MVFSDLGKVVNYQARMAEGLLFLIDLLSRATVSDHLGPSSGYPVLLHQYNALLHPLNLEQHYTIKLHHHHHLCMCNVHIKSPIFAIVKVTAIVGYFMMIPLFIVCLFQGVNFTLGKMHTGNYCKVVFWLDMRYNSECPFRPKTMLWLADTTPCLLDSHPFTSHPHF